MGQKIKISVLLATKVGALTNTLITCKCAQCPYIYMHVCKTHMARMREYTHTLTLTYTHSHTHTHTRTHTHAQALMYNKNIYNA